MRKKTNELTKAEEKRFYKKVFKTQILGKKIKPLSCEHKFIHLGERFLDPKTKKWRSQKKVKGSGITPQYSTSGGNIQQSYLILFCEKCGVVIKSFH
jgi:hypothetical protein